MPKEKNLEFCFATFFWSFFSLVFFLFFSIFFPLPSFSLLLPPLFLFFSFGTSSLNNSLLFFYCFAVDLIGVFLVFEGCQGTIVALLLPLPLFLQVSIIFHVSLILGHLKKKCSCSLQLQTATTSL